MIVLWQNKAATVLAMGVLLASVGVGLGLARLSRRVDRRRLARVHQPPSTPSVFLQGVRAIKAKVCPIIEFVE